MTDSIVHGHFLRLACIEVSDFERCLNTGVKMPVCTIHLLSLSASLPDFLTTLRNSSLKPLVTAKVARWIITPTELSKDTLLHPSQPWDLFLILPSSSERLPKEIESIIKDHWSIKAGIPSKLVDSFHSTNKRLLHPASGDVPSLTGALSHPKIAESSQALELNDELQGWITSGKGPKGAISMLNLLAFRPGKKEKYLKYGKAFAESIGSSRGGVAKIVGKVVPQSCSDGCEEWEEVCSQYKLGLAGGAKLMH